MNLKKKKNQNIKTKYIRAMEVLTANQDMEEESNFINGVMENRLYSA